VILGLLSDTHGQHRRAACAIALLERVGAEAFVHCGDVGDEAVLDELAGRRTWFVWGNIDHADGLLVHYAETLGLSAPREIPVRIEIDGRVIAVYHGHEARFSRLNHLIRTHDLAGFEKLSAGADYILHGHTHRAAVKRVGRVQLINPGALERARPHTVATLDVGRDLLKFWQVNERADPDEEPRAFVPR
jgi:putative phosphoesterase